MQWQDTTTQNWQERPHQSPREAAFASPLPQEEPRGGPPLVKPAADSPLAANPPRPRPRPPRKDSRDSRSSACLTSGVTSFSFWIRGAEEKIRRIQHLEQPTSACFSNPAFMDSSSPNSTYASFARPANGGGRLTRVICVDNGKQQGETKKGNYLHRPWPR